MSDTDQQVREIFVEFTEILVGVVDVSDYLLRLITRCVTLVGVNGAGMLVVDRNGTLGLGAASGEAAELLTRLELAYEEGPGLDAFRTAGLVESPDPAVAHARWPRWAQVAQDCGVEGAHAMPCRLRAQPVGALTLLSASCGNLPAPSIELGRAMANAASLGVRAHRSGELEALAGQLQHALDSRVIIEQAKGVIAERTHVSVSEAFSLLRNHARSTRTKLSDVARAVLDGDLSVPPG